MVIAVTTSSPTLADEDSSFTREQLEVPRDEPLQTGLEARVQRRDQLIEMFRTRVDLIHSGGGAALVSHTSEQVAATFYRQMQRTRDWRDREYAFTLSVKAAVAVHGDKARNVIKDELDQMINKRVWTPVRVLDLSSYQRRAIIRSSMFIKEKFFPTGQFEKLKARLVVGRNQ